MKRLIALTLCLLLTVLCFAGCKKTQVIEEETERASTYYLELMRKGAFGLTYIYEEGKSRYENVLYISGDAKTVMQYINGTLETQAIWTPETAYVINHTYRQYASFPPDEVTLPGVLDFPMENLQYKTSGQTKFAKENCTFDTYESEAGELTFYFNEQSNFIGMDALSYGEPVSVTVEEFTTNMTTDSFAIPANYLEVPNYLSLTEDHGEVSLPQQSDNDVQ